MESLKVCWLYNLLYSSELIIISLLLEIFIMHDAKLFLLSTMFSPDEEGRVSIYYFSKNVIIISFIDSLG